MKSRGSPIFRPTVIDTVVLRYFLLAERLDLLIQFCGEQLQVPRIVYDPADRDSDIPLSELVKSIHHQRKRSVDLGLTRAERERSKTFSTRLARIHHYHRTDQLAVVDLDEHELRHFAQLTKQDPQGLAFPLHGGEAACLAIALNRAWVFATDDNDALRVFRSLAPDHPYLRTRKILIEASGSGLIDPAEANAIHDEMRRCGFWDRTAPFPA